MNYLNYKENYHPISFIRKIESLRNLDSSLIIIENYCRLQEQAPNVCGLIKDWFDIVIAIDLRLIKRERPHYFYKIGTSYRSHFSIIVPRRYFKIIRYFLKASSYCSFYESQDLVINYIDYSRWKIISGHHFELQQFKKSSNLSLLSSLILISKVILIDVLSLCENKNTGIVT